MREVIIASHGGFAEGALDSSTMIVGEQEHVRTYRLRPGGSAADFADELREEVEKNPDVEYVILTDLYGASVCSAMIPLSVYPNVTVFSGMNLCLILEVLTSEPERLTDEKISGLVATAREGIQCVKMELGEQEDF